MTAPSPMLKRRAKASRHHLQHALDHQADHAAIADHASRIGQCAAIVQTLDRCLD